MSEREGEEHAKILALCNAVQNAAAEVWRWLLTRLGLRRRSYRETILDDTSLVGYWPIDDPDDVARDVSGQVRHGRYVEPPPPPRGVA